MIGTITIKQQQLSKGFFTIGSGSEVVLIMGSCRVAPYVNYLAFWNEQNGNRFTIHSLDPFNWNWNEKDERVDYEAKLQEMESHEGLLNMLKSVDVFIHEFYSNAGMFNLFNTHKSIYQFGMNPKIDVMLPNWNDIFVLTREIVSFDIDIKKKAIQDYNVTGKLSEQTLKDIDVVRQRNLDKFYSICSKTDFPEFADIFAREYKEQRYFWTFNHIGNKFSITIFYMLMEKFFGIPLSDEFLEKIGEHDMFANNYTKLSEYDLDYNWNEEVEPLRNIL